MNKEWFNIKGHINFIIDIIINCIIIVMGYLVLRLSDLNISQMEIIFTSLYVISAFSFIAYFINRKNNDYYYLLFSLVNVVVASFLVFHLYYKNLDFIMSDAIILYAICNLLLEGFTSKAYDKPHLLIKIPMSIVIFALGVFASVSVYNKLNISLYIIAYYFITFGMLKLLESSIYILLETSSLGKKIIKSNKKVQTKPRSKKKIKELKTRTPHINKREGEVVKKEKKVTIKKK